MIAERSYMLKPALWHNIEDCVFSDALQYFDALSGPQKLSAESCLIWVNQTVRPTCGQ